jgi:DNA-binding NtrC family response regulator
MSTGAVEHDVNGPGLPVSGRGSRELLDALCSFACQDETILITGPSGAGKSRLAELCHARSPRRAGPFQLVDLLSIPEDMQMAELFGWKRGAFTGAVRDQEGCVALSDGGTLFLDEIDKLSLRTQAGLLQFLESRRFRPLGDPGQMRAANVRFIVATNADLRAQVARGLFREDLYFRISVLPVRVPALAERTDEIVPWARYMLDRREREVAGGGRIMLTLEAQQTLLRAEWPGNLRQLDNVVRRAYALARAARAGEVADLSVDASHVERALAFEQTSHHVRPLMQSLRRAADDFIEHAIQRRAAGKPFYIEHAGALGGLVLEAGVRRLGDLREVYRLLGGDAVVRSRNHNREFRRELAKVARLLEELDPAEDAAGDPSETL